MILSIAQILPEEARLGMISPILASCCPMRRSTQEALVIWSLQVGPDNWEPKVNQISEEKACTLQPEEIANIALYFTN